MPLFHLQTTTNYKDSDFILHVKKNIANGNIEGKAIISKIKYFNESAKDLILTPRNPDTPFSLTIILVKWDSKLNLL